MYRFKRGISDEFVKKLNDEYVPNSWWQKIADDPDLIISIRDEYLNVYWRGCSLLKLSLQNDRLVGEIHYKYLLRHKTSRNQYLQIEDGKVQPFNPENLFLTNISDVDSLKRAAAAYAGGEKRGVHDIIMSNANVIDVEVAFGTENEDSGARVAQRIDFAALQQGDFGPELVFYEAKRFDNKELRANGDNSPPVMQQLKSYRDFLISSQRDLVASSYKTMISNLHDLEGVKSRFKKSEDLMSDIKCGKQALTINPDVRLVIFGYDNDQANGEVWKRHREKLKGALVVLVGEQGGDLLLQKGKPKAFTNGISPSTR